MKKTYKVAAALLIALLLAGCGPRGGGADNVQSTDQTPTEQPGGSDTDSGDMEPISTQSVTSESIPSPSKTPDSSAESELTAAPNSTAEPVLTVMPTATPSSAEIREDVGAASVVNLLLSSWEGWLPIWRANNGKEKSAAGSVYADKYEVELNITEREDLTPAALMEGLESGEYNAAGLFINDFAEIFGGLEEAGLHATIIYVPAAMPVDGTVNWEVPNADTGVVVVLDEVLNNAVLADGLVAGALETAEGLLGEEGYSAAFTDTERNHDLLTKGVLQEAFITALPEEDDVSDWRWADLYTLSALPPDGRVMTDYYTKAYESVKTRLGDVGKRIETEFAAKLDTAEDDIAVLNTGYETLSEEDFKKRADDISTRLEQLQGVHTSLNEALESLASEVAASRNEAEEQLSKEEMTVLGAEYDRLTDSHDSWEARLSQEANRHAALSGEPGRIIKLREHKIEYAGISADLRQSVYPELNKRLTELETLVMELAESGTGISRKDLDDEINKTWTEHALINSDYLEESSELESLKGRIERFKEAISQEPDREGFLELGESAEELETEREELETNIDTMGTRLTELETKIGGLATAYDAEVWSGLLAELASKELETGNNLRSVKTSCENAKTELDTLDNKIASLDNDGDAAALKQDLTNLRNGFGQIKENIADCRTLLEEWGQEIEQAEQQMDDESESWDEVALKERSDAINANKAAFGSENSLLKELSEQADVLEKGYEESQSAIEEFERKRQDEAEALAAERTKAEEVLTKLEGGSFDIGKLGDDIRGAEATLDKLTDELSKIDKALKADVSGLTLETLDKHQSQLDSIISKQEQLATDLSGSRNALSETVIAQSDVAADLNTETAGWSPEVLSALEVRINSLTKVLNERTDELDALDDRLSQAEAKRTELLGNHKRLNEELEGLKEKLLKQEEERKEQEAKDALMKLQSDLERFTLDKLTDSMSGIQGELDELNRKLMELYNNNELNAELEGIKGTMDGLDSERQALSDNLNALKEALDELTAMIPGVIDEEVSKAIKAERAEIEELLISLTSALKEKDREIEELRAMIERAENTEFAKVLWGDVFFVKNTDELIDPDATAAELAPVIGHLKSLADEGRELEITLAGCFSTLTEAGLRNESNLDLARRRAERIKTMLIDAGVSPSIIRIDRMGNISASDRDVDRAKDRRVEIRYVVGETK
jgi:chromosome segregation ATPase